MFYYSVEFGISLFFLTVAAGVFFIIYVSIIRTGFAKLATETYFIRDEDHPGIEQHVINMGNPLVESPFSNSLLASDFGRLHALVLHVSCMGLLLGHFVIGGVLEDYFIGHTKAKNKRHFNRECFLYF